MYEMIKLLVYVLALFSFAFSPNIEICAVESECGEEIVSEKVTESNYDSILEDLFNEIERVEYEIDTLELDIARELNFKLNDFLNFEKELEKKLERSSICDRICIKIELSKNSKKISEIRSNIESNDSEIAKLKEKIDYLNQEIAEVSRQRFRSGLFLKVNEKS